MIDAQDLVKTAYKKLKQMVYFEKNHLALRQRLAEFECANDFEQRVQVVADLIKTDNIVEAKSFKDWLDEIDFTLVPKGVTGHPKRNEADGTYVTNVTSGSSYTVQKVNYIFDGPVELHLLSVLWLMVEGQEYDRSLSSHCMGSRLHAFVGNNEDHSAYLFQKYHALYSKWRDDGIRIARNLLTQEAQSVCILGLDIQEYYYRIQVNWAELRAQLHRFFPDKIVAANFQQLEILGGKLFDCVEAVCRTYHDKIKDFLKLTHDLPDEATCLPIGLNASPVIANWYLKEFDNAVLSKIRPAYYGRYIDDIFIVIASETAPNGEDPIKDCMVKMLVEPGILKTDERAERYEFIARPGLFLQKKKCILQYFDSQHSIAGLDKFQKQIEENASDFALLPLEGDESPVAQVAYDILYDGSVNKFRSVKAIGEDRWELARHLAKQTQLHLLTDDKIAPAMKSELFHFFKGSNAIDYWDMWERVIAFFIVADNEKTVEKFTKATKSEIKRTHFVNGAKEVSSKVRLTLERHLNICVDLSLAIKSENSVVGGPRSAMWRKSNLIRHHLVAVPLLNYTKFLGDLTAQGEDVYLELDERKLALSPRFVHFDECLAFYDSGCSSDTAIDSILLANRLYAQFHGEELEDVQSQAVEAKGLEAK